MWGSFKVRGLGLGVPGFWGSLKGVKVLGFRAWRFRVALCAPLRVQALGVRVLEFGGRVPRP